MAESNKGVLKSLPDSLLVRYMKARAHFPEVRRSHGCAIVLDDCVDARYHADGLSKTVCIAARQTLHARHIQGSGLCALIASCETPAIRLSGEVRSAAVPTCRYVSSPI